MKPIMDQPDKEPVQKGVLRFIWSLIPLVLLLAIIIFLVMMCGAKKEAIDKARAGALKAEDPGVNVVTLKLDPRPFQDKMILPGKIEPYVQIEVVSEVQGQVVSREKKEGEKVNQGDLILSIESDRYENGFQAAKSAYEAAILSKERLTKLYSKQLSNKSDLDDITAQVENLKALMENAALDLAHCAIKSPISGILNRIHVERGQFVSMGAPVCEVIQIDSVKLTVGIPESDITEVRKTDSYTLRVDALGGREFMGKKAFLSKIAGKEAILYDLDIVLPNPNLDLLPGMFARVEIVKSEEKEALVIPLYAIISNHNSHIVYVEKNLMAEKREIEPGFQEGWMIQVKHGLAPGEKVVITGQRNLNQGQKLKVIREIKEIEELNQ